MDIWIEQENQRFKKSKKLALDIENSFPPRSEGKHNCVFAALGLENPDAGKFAHI